MEYFKWGIYQLMKIFDWWAFKHLITFWNFKIFEFISFKILKPFFIPIKGNTQNFVFVQRLVKHVMSLH